MNATVEAETKAKATETTKTMKTPETVFSCFDRTSVSGNGLLIMLNWRSGLPVASLRIDWYMNCGYRAETS